MEICRFPLMQRGVAEGSGDRLSLSHGGETQVTPAVMTRDNAPSAEAPRCMLCSTASTLVDGLRRDARQPNPRAWLDVNRLYVRLVWLTWARWPITFAIT